MSQNSSIQDWIREHRDLEISDLLLGVDIRILVGLFVVISGALRVFQLGKRPLHWDEARVTYWTLQFMETGSFQYRPVIHGPFFHYANSPLFEILGVTPTIMRFWPVLVGTFLPLTALGFLSVLDRSELLGVALILSLNPVLVYFSRFMRGDMLVGGFLFAAFAFLVAAQSRSNPWYVAPALVCIALGFTVKENALLYLLAWMGSLGLILSHRTLSLSRSGLSLTDSISTVISEVSSSIRPKLRATAIGGILSFAVILYFYAPRRPETGVGIEDVNSLSSALSLVSEATIGSILKLYQFWVLAPYEELAYSKYFIDLSLLLIFIAPVLLVCSVVGYIVERKSTRPRLLVYFCFYWGVASLVGYPVATDIRAPWTMVHVILPLVIPAAVGLRVVVNKVSKLLGSESPIYRGGTASAVLLSSIYLFSLFTMSVYAAPAQPGNPLAHYAQPSDDIRSTLEAASHRDSPSGTDVLLVGPALTGESSGFVNSTFYPRCADWFTALPLPYYFDRFDLTAECAQNASVAQDAISTAPSVIVVHRGNHTNLDAPDTYRNETYGARVFEKEFFVYVHKDVEPREPVFWYRHADDLSRHLKTGLPKSL